MPSPRTYICASAHRHSLQCREAWWVAFARHGALCQHGHKAMLTTGKRIRRRDMSTHTAKRTAQHNHHGAQGHNIWQPNRSHQRHAASTRGVPSIVDGLLSPALAGALFHEHGLPLAPSHAGSQQKGKLHWPVSALAASHLCACCMLAKCCGSVLLQCSCSCQPAVCSSTNISPGSLRRRSSVVSLHTTRRLR